eukprot:TRINITY_DN12476_c0_g1_i4.p1 TRINITY_DN12476_c0_g1~~TRINITY_DN12476_c0_g1_i4.p1  ORF type:complete len:527 (-),score=159.44 TRINITY_DN12476_c0_g1_i4:117-1697(-)
MPSEHTRRRGSKSESETDRLRLEVQDLQDDKLHTQHQLDKIHTVLEMERKALKEVLAAARQAVDDLKVENLGLTQALTTEREARVKDRDAYTAELEAALDSSKRSEQPSSQGSFDELARELKALILQMEGPDPTLRQPRSRAGPAVRPVVTAIRACFLNTVRKKELAEATLESETIKYEMKLLDMEARLSSERAGHFEEIEQMRSSSQGASGSRDASLGRRGNDAVSEGVLLQLSELEEKLQQVTAERDMAERSRQQSSFNMIQEPAPAGISGFVLKKGESTDIWRQRWCVIDRTHVRLFDPQGTNPKTSVHLSKVKKVKTNAMKKPSAISLEIHSKGAEVKMIYLDFERKDNARQWLAALQGAQELMANGGSPAEGVRGLRSPSQELTSPREIQLETDLDKLRTQAKEDEEARTAMARRLETVEEAFDDLATSMLQLERGNWQEVRTTVRNQLADLGLIEEESDRGTTPGSPAVDTPNSETPVSPPKSDTQISLGVDAESDTQTRVDTKNATPVSPNTKSDASWF